MRSSSILILLLAALSSTNAIRGGEPNVRELKRDKDKGRKKGKGKGGEDTFGDKREDRKDKRRERFSRIVPFRNTRIRSLNDMTANDAGLLHTAAFEEFALLNQGAKEITGINAMMDMSEIMSSYCGDDEVCSSMAFKSTIEAFQKPVAEEGKLTFPESMDSKVQAHLELTEVVINSMTEDNIDEVIATLDFIQKDIEAMEGVNPEYQQVGAASVAVARESAKFWTEVYNQKDHSLHDFVFAPLNPEDELDQRRLQVAGPAINVTVEVNYDIIVDNIQEAVVEIITAVFESVDAVVNLVNVVITGMLDLTIETIEATVDAVRDAVLSVVDSFVEVIVSIKDLGVAVGTAVYNVADEAIDTTIAVANATVQAGIQIVDTTVDVTIQTVQTGVQATVNLANATVQAADAVVDATVDVAVAVAGKAVEAVVDVAESVVDVAEATVDAVVGVVEGTIDAIQTAFQRVIQVVRADFAGAGTGGTAMVALIEENPTLMFPLNWIPMFFVAVFWFAVPASTRSAFRL